MELWLIKLFGPEVFLNKNSNCGPYESIPHGWGHGRKGVKQKIAQAHAGVSVNDITDDTLIDQLSGNAAVNGVPV